MDMNKVLAKYNITEDIRFMEAFLKECYCYPYNIVEYLRDWYDAKNEFLFKLFGDKVSIDCGEINFHKDYYEIEDDMYCDEVLCENRSRLSSLIAELTTATLANPPVEGRWWTSYPSAENELFADVLRECTTFSFLFNNGTNIKKKYKAKLMTEDGRVEYVHIHKHQKIAKIFNNFYKTVEKVFPKKYSDKIAEARALTSSVLAQVAMYVGRSETTGRLHLSIHPFDYITMSQNSCGWSSCMALCDDYEDVGDYCAGTVACMNSKSVIVAYLDAKTPYNPCMRGEFAETDWNNKKYRNLVIVDPLLISAVRGYPHVNKEIDKVILEKLAELAEKNLGWTFENNVYEGRNRYDAEDAYIDLNTDKMYNDTAHWEAQYLRGHLTNLDITPSVAKKENNIWYLRYDAPVKCLECHGDIGHSNHPRCSECRGICICNHCGDEISQDNAIMVKDRTYCHYCYDEYFFECPGCGEEAEQGFSTEGEYADLAVYIVLENQNFDEKVKDYQDRMATYKSILAMDKDERPMFYSRPSVPDRFISRNSIRLCKHCLEKAVKDGYITWGGYYNEEHKSHMWDYFFLTSKALKDKKFLDKMDYCSDTSTWKGIGHDEYLDKLSAMKPIKIHLD